MSRQLGFAAVLVVLYVTSRRLSYPWSMKFVRVSSDVWSGRLWMSLAIEWHEFFGCLNFFFSLSVNVLVKLRTHGGSLFVRGVLHFRSRRSP